MLAESRANLNAAVAAAVLSVAVHALLLAFAGRLDLGSLPPPRAPAPPRRLIVSVMDIRDRVFRPPEETPESLRRDLAKELVDAAKTDERVRDVLDRENLIPKPDARLELKGLGRNLVLPELDVPAPPKAATAPRIQILDIDADRLPPDALSADRPLQAKVPRVLLDADRLPSFADDGPLSRGSPPALGVGLRLSMPNTGPDLAKLPPESAGPAPAVRPDTSTALPGLPGFGDDDGFDSLDDLLTVAMTVYEPEQGDGYFRIDISPNAKSQRLRTIRKDVLLLVDCSTSIQPAKLEAFRQAALLALDLLNVEDRFNVVSFRVAPENLFEAYEPVTQENVAKAKKYVARLMRGGLTDVYAGLAPYVGSRAADPGRPLLVYILSDGKSTVRNKLDNDALLQRIAEINRSDVTIYSAGAGQGINRFLLDLLAYSNRGTPLYRADVDGFDKDLAHFVGAHRDLIVAGIDYSITGGLAGQIFPRRLPHLYRDSALAIYGRYPKGTREIGLRLAGVSASGAKQDFIYRGDIAKASRGSPDLGMDWIAHKVFHLIVQRALKPDPAIDRELSELRERYQLEIPYLE